MQTRFDRITIEPGKMGGQPCIRGMRIPVSIVVGQLARGRTTEDILLDYPDLTIEDIRAALTYAAWRSSEREVVLEESA